MKRKWKIAAAAACVLFLVTVAYAATAGSQSDPLVTLSYLNNVFTGKVETMVDQAVSDRQTQIKGELDQAIQTWDTEIRNALGSSSGGGSAFAVVALNQGQTLVGSAGCEIILRSGSAAWTSDSGQGLMDVTAGGAAVSSQALAANHLYLAVGSGKVTPASQNTGTVNTSKLYVRSGPGSSYQPVGSLTSGAVVTILGSSSGWYQITSDSLSGYVSADYVTVNSSTGSGAVTLMVRGSYQVR